MHTFMFVHCQCQLGTCMSCTHCCCDRRNLLIELSGCYKKWKWFERTNSTVHGLKRVKGYTMMFLFLCLVQTNCFCSKFGLFLHQGLFVCYYWLIFDCLHIRCFFVFTDGTLRIYIYSLMLSLFIVFLSFIKSFFFLSLFPLLTEIAMKLCMSGAFRGGQ